MPVFLHGPSPAIPPSLQTLTAARCMQQPRHRRRSRGEGECVRHLVRSDPNGGISLVREGDGKPEGPEALRDGADVPRLLAFGGIREQGEPENELTGLPHQNQLAYSGDQRVVRRVRDRLQQQRHPVRGSRNATPVRRLPTSNARTRMEKEYTSRSGRSVTSWRPFAPAATSSGPRCSCG